MALINKLQAVGNAIRSKTGKTDLLTLDQMPAEIEGIKTGGGNGIRTPEEIYAQDRPSDWPVLPDPQPGEYYLLVPAIKNGTKVGVVSFYNTAGEWGHMEGSTFVKDGDIAADSYGMRWSSSTVPYEGYAYKYIVEKAVATESQTTSPIVGSPSTSSLSGFGANKILEVKLYPHYNQTMFFKCGNDTDNNWNDCQFIIWYGNEDNLNPNIDFNFIFRNMYKLRTIINAPFQRGGVFYGLAYSFFNDPALENIGPVYTKQRVSYSFNGNFALKSIEMVGTGEASIDYTFDSTCSRLQRICFISQGPNSYWKNSQGSIKDKVSSAIQEYRYDGKDSKIENIHDSSNFPFYPGVVWDKLRIYNTSSSTKKLYGIIDIKDVEVSESSINTNDNYKIYEIGISYAASYKNIEHIVSVLSPYVKTLTLILSTTRGNSNPWGDEVFQERLGEIAVTNGCSLSLRTS